MAATALGQDLKSIASNGDLLGNVLDNFVLSQLRPEIVSPSSNLQAFHLRKESGRHEVDILIEVSGKGVLALEVNATASPGIADARHLVWLKNQLGERFIAGAVMHTGPAPFLLESKVLALPIYTIWNQ